MASLHKIASKLNNKHVFSLLGNGVMAAVGMLVSVILFRTLSFEEMGAWIVFFSTVLLFDTIRSGIITMAFVKFFAGTVSARADAVVGSTWYLAIVITLMLLLLNIPAYFIAFHIRSIGFAYFLKWFGLIYLASLPFFVTSCVLQVKQRFDQLLVLRLFNQGTFVLLLLLLATIKWINIDFAIYAYLCSNLIASVVGICLGWAAINKLRYSSKSVVKELIGFGKFSVGTNLSATLLGSLDTYIINFMLGASALAVYNTGMRLLQVVEIPLISFASTAMPTFSALYNQERKDELLLMANRYIVTVTLLFVPIIIATFIFADAAVWLLAGAKYVHTAAPNVLRLFMLVALLYPLDRFLALVLDVFHKPQINLVKVLIMLLVNFVADMIFIYYFKSVYGAIMGSVLALLTAIAISYFALKKNNVRINLSAIYQGVTLNEIKSFIFNRGK